MTIPRELLGVRNDLAEKVAERQIDRAVAVAELRAEVSNYPEMLDKLTDDWADTEIDKGVKRYVARRNKTDDAAIVRRLAELGLERPTLDGDVIPISQYDPSYSVTLADYGDYMSTNLASAWRLVKSFENREGDHELLTAAVDGDLSITRERALDALKCMPEAKRKALRIEVEAKLSAERSAFLQERYGDYGQAAEG